jgi:ABC-type histidine transport system ATPase subunit
LSQTFQNSIPRRAIAVENLHKSFGPLEVLKGVSLTAHEGDVIAMIGSSGSGKSTLLRCINFLEIPASGEIYVGDEHIRLTRNRKGQTIPADNRQVDRIRTKLGMVFQHFNLWSHMTVLDNVIEAPVHVLKKPKKESREKGMAYLEKVGIADRSHYYPAQLSGGQKQRAAIARALAMEPEVLLFDEPTSALDPELVGEVLNVMQELAKEGRTMIMATHEMGFARDVSSHVIFLHNGIIEDEGPPGYIFQNPKSERCRQFLSRFSS